MKQEFRSQAIHDNIIFHWTEERLPTHPPWTLRLSHALAAVAGLHLASIQSCTESTGMSASYKACLECGRNGAILMSMQGYSRLPHAQHCPCLCRWTMQQAMSHA